MMRRTPLARKRVTPRVKRPERVECGRIKPKYRPLPNAEEKRHEARLYLKPCIGCGKRGVELHHTMIEFPAKRWRRDHRFQLPVCSDCHRGPEGIHGIGSELLWARRNGLNTAAIAQDLWAESVAAEAKDKSS